MTAMKHELLTLLKPFGQEHLLAFWEELDAASRERFAEQLRAVDFARIRDMYAERDRPAESVALADRAQDPPAYRFSTVPSGGPACSAPVPVSARQAVEAGEQALRAGKVGVVLVAGGQGTRLGFDHPKGMYPIGPVTERTLFRIHVEKILATAKKHGKPVPLAVMTSPATHEETLRYFRENGNFGLPDDDLYVFCQGTMPAVAAADGKLLLAEKDSLALSPDGHGGMLAAMAKPGPDGTSVLDRLEKRGIESLFYFQVDNPLVRICSPEYIGYALCSGAEMTCQVIRKRFPNDRVGNVVAVDGSLWIIEYSDLPEEVARRTRSDGSLAIWAGSIAVHMFHVGFLRRTAASKQALPAHIARKKVSCIDPATGRRLTPSEPNAIKFEQFIFDLLPAAKNAVVVEVDIPNHYGPLKNAPGSPNDSPETVRRQLSDLYACRLRAAGIEIAENTWVEISPLDALEPEDIGPDRKSVV